MLLGLLIGWKCKYVRFGKTDGNHSKQGKWIGSPQDGNEHENSEQQRRSEERHSTGAEGPEEGTPMLEGNN